MTNIELKLKNRIMRRVYAAWLLRNVFSFSFARFTIFFLALLSFFREVSVLSVINNLPSDFFSDLNYLASAFSTTEITVQLYLISMSMVIAWFVKDRMFGSVQGLGFIRS